jgi:hypothetical protein
MKKFLILFSLFVIILNSCCDDDDSIINETCDFNSEIIAENDFSGIDTSNYLISAVQLNNDCLEITISSSGCDASLWKMNLFSTNAFYNIYPLQRTVKIELINNQACLAVFQKTISFNLIPFQIKGQNQLPLNIEGWNEQIIYKY